MVMSVVQIRIMGMVVGERSVMMQMHVRLVSIPREIVLMEMMSFVHVRMGVIERFVAVFVRVALGQVQNNARRHQASR